MQCFQAMLMVPEPFCLPAPSLSPSPLPSSDVNDLSLAQLFEQPNLSFLIWLPGGVRFVEAECKSGSRWSKAGKTQEKIVPAFMLRRLAWGRASIRTSPQQPKGNSTCCKLLEHSHRIVVATGVPGGDSLGPQRHHCPISLN